MNVVFCDIVGSTALSEQLDPEDLREFVQNFQLICAEAISHFQGHIAQFLGDGILVYFGYPVASDDDAQRAVRAGLEIVRRVSQERVSGEPLRVRVGIHSGLVVVGQVGVAGHLTQLAIGETPNVAARVQAEAEPGTVLISGATERLVRGFFATELHGEQRLRGLSQPVKLYRVIAESGAKNRLEAATTSGLTRFIGRVEELAQLLQFGRETVEGHGRLVSIRGESGVGKSRLVAALKERLGDPFEVIECACSEYLRNSAFHPLVGALSEQSGIAASHGAEERLDRLKAYLHRRGVSASHAVSALADLLSIGVSEAGAVPAPPPARRRTQIMEALSEWILRLAADQPRLLVLEDVQWADASTLELIKVVADHLPSSRVLVLLTFRPDFAASGALTESLTIVDLQRLSQEEATLMASQVARGKSLPFEVSSRIDDWTKGVPLYVEEFMKGLLESGVLQERENHFELSGALPKSAIPETLAGSLAANIDRLGPAKPLAQLASVLGITFRYDMLRFISDMDENVLQDGLATLVHSDVLFGVTAGTQSLAGFAFKHALIREAAYNSLLVAHRKELHRRIVEALNGRFHDVAESQPEVLAYHCTQAGLIDAAVGAWQRASEKALARAANWEALAHIDEGLRQLERLPPTHERQDIQLAFHLARGPALMAIKGYQAPEVKATYRRAQELCESQGALPRIFPVLWGFWAHHFVAGELEPARAFGEEVLSLAKKTDDPALLVPAYHALGYTLCYTADYLDALELARAGIALHDFETERKNVQLFQFSSTVAMHHFAANSLWMLGYPDRAQDEVSRAVALAEALSHPPSLAYAKSALTWGVPFLRGEHHAVKLAATEAISLSREEAFSLWPPLVRTFRAWSTVADGDVQEGLAQMRESLAAYRASGGGILQTSIAALLAEATWKSGDSAAALQILADALSSVVATQEHNYEPELYRVRGIVLASSAGRNLGGPVDADESFRAALDLARRQRSKSLELRAAVSFAEFTAARGRAEEGRQILAEIYAWFSEGFDSPDLLAAKALLDSR